MANITATSYLIKSGKDHSIIAAFDSLITARKALQTYKNAYIHYLEPRINSEKQTLNIDKAIAAAIINNDMSGLNETECNCINAFCEKYYIYPPQSEMYDNFKKCEVTNLAADCYELEYHLITKES